MTKQVVIRGRGRDRAVPAGSPMCGRAKHIGRGSSGGPGRGVLEEVEPQKGRAGRSLIQLPGAMKFLVPLPCYSAVPTLQFQWPQEAQAFPGSEPVTRGFSP